MGSIEAGYQESKTVRALETDRHGCASSIDISDAPEDDPSEVQYSGALLASGSEMINNRRCSSGDQLFNDTRCHGTRRYSLPDVLQRQTTTKQNKDATDEPLFGDGMCENKLLRDSVFGDHNDDSEDKRSIDPDSFENTSDADLPACFHDSVMTQNGEHGEITVKFFVEPQNDAEASSDGKQMSSGCGYTERGYEVHFERVSDDNSSSGGSSDDAASSPLPPPGKARPYPARLSPIDSSGEEHTSDTRPPRSPSPEGAGRDGHPDGNVAPSALIGDLSPPTWPDTRRRPPPETGSRTRVEDQPPCDADMTIQSRPSPDDATRAVDSHCPPDKLPSVAEGPETGEIGEICDAQLALPTHRHTHTESSEAERHLFSTTASLPSTNFPESGEVSPLGKTTEAANSEAEVEDFFMSSGLNQDNASPTPPHNTEMCISNENCEDVVDITMSRSSEKYHLATGQVPATDSVTSLEHSHLSSDLSAGGKVLTSDTSRPDGGQMDNPNPLPPASGENLLERRDSARTAAATTPPRKYSDLYSNFETPCEPRYRLHAEHDRSKVYLGPVLSRTRPAVVCIEIPPCVLNEPPPPSAAAAPAPAAAAPAPAPATASAAAVVVPVVSCDDRWATDDEQVLCSATVDEGCQTPREVDVSLSPPPTPPPSPQSGEKSATTGDAPIKTPSSTDQMTPAEALMTALSGGWVIAERDASPERVRGSFERVSDGVGDGVVTEVMTAASDKKREQRTSDNEVESSTCDSLSTEDEVQAMLPSSKPPEKMQAYEEIIEIQECPPRDSVDRFGADAYLCDRSSTDAEPDLKFTTSAKGMLEKLPRNGSSDASSQKSDGNDPQLQLDNVDSNVTLLNTDIIGTVIPKDVIVSKGFDSHANATDKVQAITDDMNDKDGSFEIDEGRQMPNQIITEYKSEVTAGIINLTVPIKISTEFETYAAEKDAFGMDHASASSSDSSSSVDTVKAVCSTPQPRTLSSCSLSSVADSTDAADSLPDDSVELQLSTAVTCGRAPILSCSPSASDSEDICSLSQVDTPDTPSTPDTSFSRDSSNGAEISYMSSAPEDSFTEEGPRATTSESSPSVTTLEEREEKTERPDVEADKGGKLVSSRTVYWSPAYPPPPQQDSDEPVLLHFVTIDPDAITPVTKIDQNFRQREVQGDARPLDGVSQTTEYDEQEMAGGSQREEQVQEPDMMEPVCVSAVSQAPEVESDLPEPGVTSGFEEPDDTSGRRKQASVVVYNRLLSNPATLDGYVARIVRRHSTCGEDATPPSSSGRRLSPTNFSLDEAKKMLERGSHPMVKPQGER